MDLATQPRSDIDWNWPDLVMISAMLIQQNNFIELIREAKNRGKTVVVGGPIATSVPEDSLAAGCDFLVRGEGENTIPLLLESLKQGQSGGVIENPEKPDLSLSPVPRFDLLNLRNYEALGIQIITRMPIWLRIL